MKNYEYPIMEVIIPQNNDILVTSGREDELPMNRWGNFELPIIEN